MDNYYAFTIPVVLKLRYGILFLCVHLRGNTIFSARMQKNLVNFHNRSLFYVLIYEEIPYLLCVHQWYIC